MLRQAGRLLGGLLEIVAVAYAFPAAILAVTLGIGAPLALLVVGVWRLTEAVSRLGWPP